MDVSTVVGLVSGFALIIGSIVIQGGGANYIEPSSILITVGGSLAATLVTHPLSHLTQIIPVLKVVFAPKTRSASFATINQLVSLSETARREGLLAMEETAAEVEDPFLKKGMQLVVDGVDPDTVRNVLEMEVAYLEERHRIGQAIFESLGAYAPAFGMIGTLIGLVQMLGNLDDPEQIGPAMAVALLTTFYGAILANLVFLPIANKLRLRNEEEVTYEEMVIEGVLSIQAGENPRLLREKLLAFLHFSSRLEKPGRSVQEEPSVGVGGETIEV